MSDSRAEFQSSSTEADEQDLPETAPVLVWLTGLTFFLACTATAYVVFPTPSPVHASADLESSKEAEESRQRALESRVASVYSELETVAQAEVAAVDSALSEFLDRESLRPILLQLEQSSDNADAQRLVLRQELESELVKRKLDFAVYAPWTGDAVFAVRSSSEAASELSADDAKFIRELSESVLRSGTRRTGLAPFPPSFLPIDGTRLADGQEAQYFVSSSAPIHVRPDVASGALIVGRDLTELLGRFATVTGRDPDLRYHVFAKKPGQTAKVVTGACDGLSVRSALLNELTKHGTSSVQAFLDGANGKVGRWMLLPGLGSHALGWGVTVKPAVFEGKAASSLVSSQEEDLLARLSAEGIVDAIVVGALAFLALVVLGAFFYISSNRRDSKLIVVEGAAVPAPIDSDDASLTTRDRRFLDKRLARVPMDAREAVTEAMREQQSNLEEAMSGEFSKLRTEVETFRNALVTSREDLEDLVREASPGHYAVAPSAGPDAAGEEALSALVSEIRSAVESSLELYQPPKHEDLGELRSVLEQHGGQLETIGSSLQSVSKALQGSGKDDEAVDRVLRSLEAVHAKFDSLAHQSPAAPAVATAVATSEGSEAEIESLREHWQREMEKVRAEVNQTKALGEELVEELESARDTEHRLRSELEEARARENELITAASQENTARKRYESENADLLDKVRMLEERGHANSEEVERLRSDVHGFAETRELLERDVEQLRNALTSTEEMQSELEARSSSFERERDELRSLLEQSSEQRGVEMLARNKELLSEVSELGQRAREAERSLGDANKEVEGLKQKNERANELVREAEGRAAQGSKQQLEDLREEIQGVQDFQEALICGNLPSAMLAVDPEGVIFVWNPECERLLGLARDDVLGRRFLDVEFDAPELAHRVSSCVDEVFAQGRAISSDVESFTLRGADIHLGICSEPVVDPAGKVLGVIIGLDDQTAHAERVRECEVQEQFLDSVADSLPMGLIVVDVDQRIITFSPKAEAILRVEESAALGTPLLEAGTPLQADSAFCRRIEEGVDGKQAVTLTVADPGAGRRAKLSVHVSPLVNAGERCGHVLLVDRV
ncbi:MAG: PAS domain-containing protein [Planctomycetota bacterium]